MRCFASILSLTLFALYLNNATNAAANKTNDVDKGSQKEVKDSQTDLPILQDEPMTDIAHTAVNGPFHEVELNTHPPRRSPYYRVVLESSTPHPICLGPLDGDNCSHGEHTPQTIAYYANLHRKIPINRPISPSFSTTKVGIFDKKVKRKRSNVAASHLQPSSSEPVSYQAVDHRVYPRGATSGGQIDNFGGYYQGESSSRNDHTREQERKAAATAERSKLIASLKFEQDILHGLEEARRDQQVPKIMMLAVNSKSAHGKQPFSPFTKNPGRKMTLAKKSNGAMTRYSPDHRHYGEASPSEESSSIRGPYNKSTSSDTSSDPPSPPDSPPPPPTSFQLEKKGKMITK